MQEQALASSINNFYRKLADDPGTAVLDILNAVPEHIAAALAALGFPVDVSSITSLPSVPLRAVNERAYADLCSAHGAVRIGIDDAVIVATEEFTPERIIRTIVAPVLKRTYTGSNFYAMHDIASCPLHTPAFCRAIAAVTKGEFPEAVGAFVAALARCAGQWLAAEKAADLERLKHFVIDEASVAISHITLIGKAMVLPDAHGRRVSVTEKYGIHEHNYFRAGVFYDTTLGLKAFDLKGMTQYYHPDRFPVIFDKAVHAFRDRIEREVRAHLLSDSYQSPADMPKSIPIDASGMDPYLAALCAEKVRLENEKITREKLEHPRALDGFCAASKGKFRYDAAKGELIVIGPMKESEFKEIAKLYPRAEEKETVHRMFQRSQPSLTAGDIDKLIDLNLDDIRMEVMVERWPLSGTDRERLAGGIAHATSIDQLKQAGRKIGYFFREDMLKAADEHTAASLFMSVTRDGSLVAFRPDTRARKIRALAIDEKRKELLLQWFFTFAREERLNAREQKRRFQLPFGGGRAGDADTRSGEELRMELGKLLYRRFTLLRPRPAAPPKPKAVIKPVLFTDAAAWLAFSSDEANAFFSGDLKRSLVDTSRMWKNAVALPPDAVLSIVREHFPRSDGWTQERTAAAMQRLRHALGQHVRIPSFDRFVRMAALLQITGKPAAKAP